ncbi:hypothetical protein JAAARDRAFT_42400 [Jaapia argillacea MUCL 33604]|uniref:Ketoreductase (KR) domain-containing protein n=1 Tax=Jaapia argillacea MUCL 33604 TaxID=933084 RepID=A0A067P550_9AGAM|nr:hypothetical protein JAAARDRAFT_42400 [Jaapia argillacea MUCL 33604]
MSWRLFARNNAIERFRHGERPWALVTGASDGIGKALAHSLADRGFNVLLHGRNSAKLDQVREELLLAYPTREFDIIVADATQPALVSKVAEAVVGKRVTVVINNVGDVGGPVQLVTNATAEDIEKCINLGVSWLPRLTRVLLPHLITNQPSLIINIGSLVAEHPAPYLAIYSAANAYTQAFTHALAVEN